MLQNLKVDIIYHLTNSDFEMEFNMCGCCRMRLLSDKTADRKTLIAALSRAVGRSRIIIACGPLFSADGLIATVATAIGSKTVPVDNAAYGINGGDTIDIIAGSTPLVTSDGYFGGCIIESGPQTIILLTENKALRKSIMQNLIHPYIEEMSMLPIKEKTAPQEVEPEPIAETEKQIEEKTPENSVEQALEVEQNAVQGFVPATVQILNEDLPEQEEQVEVSDDAGDEAISQEDIVDEDTTEADAQEDIGDDAVDEQSDTFDEEISDTEEAMPESEDLETESAEQESEAVVDTDNSFIGEPQTVAPVLEYIADIDAADEREIPFVFDEEEKKQMQELSDKMSDAYGSMYIEPERVKHSHTDKYAASYTPTEENDSFLSDADYVSYKKGYHRKNLNVPIIILAVVLLLIVGVLGFFLFLQPRLQGVDTVGYLREIFDTVNNTVYV